MKTLMASIGVLAIVGVISAAVFFFFGFFNVAANYPDPEPVAWALGQVSSSSIARHASDQSPVSLTDQATVEAGARAFSQRGCTNCHGGPGVDWAKFSEGLNPGPPDLKDVANDLSPGEIFWVVKNGIRMTGMPSFSASDPPVPDDEIWKITAFVKKLPSVSDDDYKAWTASH